MGQWPVSGINFLGVFEFSDSNDGVDVGGGNIGIDAGFFQTSFISAGKSRSLLFL